MARVLLTTWGSLGDLHPYLRIARQLTRTGHDVVLATCGAHRDIVRSAGVAFHPVRPDLRPGDASLTRRRRDWRGGSAVIIEEVLAPAVRGAYEDLLPLGRDADVIVSHPMTFAAPLVATFLEKRWLSTVLAPASFFSIHDFPVPPQAPAIGNLLMFGSAAGRVLRAVARSGSAPWMGPVRALRADLGLPDAGHPLFEGQFSPDGTLALFSSVLADPQRDWPARTTVTGFVFGAVDRLPDSVAAFVDAGGPPIVFTIGNAAIDGAGNFFELALQAAAQLDRRAVLLVGRRLALPSSTTMPAHVLVLDYAAHDALFPRAAAVVHHGGIGTLAEALRAGTPMIIVPFAQDQPDNAKRAGRLGVARVVRPRDANEGALASELEALLAESTYARTAVDVAQRVGGEDGLALACAKILDLAGDAAS